MMMKKNGFTFVELMIGIAISVFIMSVVFGFYIMAHKLFFKGRNKSDLMNQAKNTLNIMCEELNRAEKIEEITDVMIRFKAHPLKPDKNSVDSTELQDITYILDRDDNTLKRISDYDEKVLFDASNINIDKDEDKIPLFTPFIKRRNSSMLDKWEVEYSDTEKQNRICYLRIRISGSIKKESIDVVTGVRLEFMHAKQLQPDWNF
ncbi:MAG: hypothetical protein C0601_04905 [Candidatus Muiribacterium halophilum]|uniref:Type II secretion system protein J n=1 Tax=Muiribacterium halophilum TaxID=2053465 RepID=A0A2N5ZI25_MUIH1|nr:MAG: hypothetical protein C0601_04905 [Candidatus Muirbacterium halophilum]